MIRSVFNSLFDLAFLILRIVIGRYYINDGHHSHSVVRLDQHWLRLSCQSAAGGEARGGLEGRSVVLLLEGKVRLLEEGPAELQG